MYLLAIFGKRRFYGNEAINSFIKSYMNTLEKAELTSSVRHIRGFYANAKNGERTFVKQEVKEQDKWSEQNIILSKEEIV